MQMSNASAHSSNQNNSLYLTQEQIEKLKHLLDRSIPICSSSGTSAPVLYISPAVFLRQLLNKFKEYQIDLEYVRLNGGAASFVLVDDPNFVYRDIDILFYIRTPLSSELQTTLFSSNHQAYSCDVWTLIKYIVCSCLLEHIHNATSANQEKQQQHYTHHYLSTVLETYAKKIIKISSDQDSWALLSLQNPAGQNLELKFVEHLKRQWQFSVDSFQINLEPLIDEKRSHLSHRNASHLCKCSSISSITKTIRTKSLVIDAINGLTIIKKEGDEAKEKSYPSMVSCSPLQFGFFTPSSSPPNNSIAEAEEEEEENPIECQTLATITTIATSSSHVQATHHQGRTRLGKTSTHDESNGVPLQFHLSLNDDTDDGIVSDADESVNEEDDQVFRTPVDNNSAPASPATIIALDVPTLPSTPLIEVHSAYSDLHQALEHLKKKLIATHAPETMRGGGLLKYCDLLAQNYQIHDQMDMSRIQRYMCSRFFIDYKTIPEQIHVITQYINTHFLPLSLSSTMESSDPLTLRRINSSQSTHLASKTSHQQTQEQMNLSNARLCLLFFDHLLTVIQQSTVCLTHQDKELTLISINQLKESYHYQYEPLFVGDQEHYQRYHHYSHQHCSSSSSNSSRSSSPSSSSSNSYRYYRQSHHRQNHFQYRHHHHHHQNSNFHRHNNSNSSSSYHHHQYSSRNYSNGLNSNVPSPLINPSHQRRHQS